MSYKSLLSNYSTLTNLLFITSSVSLKTFKILSESLRGG